VALQLRLESTAEEAPNKPWPSFSTKLRAGDNPVAVIKSGRPSPLKSSSSKSLISWAISGPIMIWVPYTPVDLGLEPAVWFGWLAEPDEDVGLELAVAVWFGWLEEPDVDMGLEPAVWFGWHVETDVEPGISPQMPEAQILLLPLHTAPEGRSVQTSPGPDPAQDVSPLAQHSNGESAKASERPQAPKAHILLSRHTSPAASFSSRHKLSSPQTPEAQRLLLPRHEAPEGRSVQTSERLYPSQDVSPLAQHSNGESVKASERPQAPETHIVSSRHDSPAAFFSSRHKLSLPQMPEAQRLLFLLHAEPEERPVQTFLRLKLSKDDFPLAQQTNGESVKASERPQDPETHILSSWHDSPAAFFSSRHTLPLPQMPEAQRSLFLLHAAPEERPVQTFLRLKLSNDAWPLAQQTNGESVKASERPQAPKAQSLSCVQAEATTAATENKMYSAKRAVELVGLRSIMLYRRIIIMRCY